VSNDIVATMGLYFRSAELKKIYLIPPSFFGSRTLRKSLNPLTRIRNSRQSNGPSILLKSTLLGFREIGIKVVKNLKMHDPFSAPFWIPAGDLSALNSREIEILSNSNVTLGPNIDWFNLDTVNVISKLGHVKVLVPHPWVISPVSSALPGNCQVLVWHSGIDTVYWKKERHSHPVFEVLIYVKNFVDVKNLRIAEEYLQRNQIPFTVVKYGFYTQSQFKSTLNRVSAAIWIGGTESQGLALLECWSMNVPTLVLNNGIWQGADGRSYPASSAPYLLDSIGLFSNSSIYSEDDFRNFISNLDNFSSRRSVYESFSLSACASNLLKHLEL